MASSVLPLKQYEMTLQNAQRVLACLLEQPTRPWLYFPELVKELHQQTRTLRERAAACKLQRFLRRTPPSPTRARAAASKPARASAKKQAAQPEQRHDALRPLAPQPSKPAAAMPQRAAAAATQNPVAPAAAAPAAAPSTTAAAALNPIEKRRQMVAAQLAMSNPSRLARSRRAQLAVSDQSAKPSAASTSTSSSSSVQLPKLPATPRQAAATSSGGEGSCPTFRGSMQELNAAFAEQDQDDCSQLLSPSGEGTALELLLKEELVDEDPLDQIAQVGCSQSAGLSLAPPPGFLKSSLGQQASTTRTSSTFALSTTSGTSFPPSATFGCCAGKGVTPPSTATSAHLDGSAIGSLPTTPSGIAGCIPPALSRPEHSFQHHHRGVVRVGY